MIELKNMSKDELIDELRKTNKKIVDIVLGKSFINQDKAEEKLFSFKREILAKLNPINL